MVCGGVIGLIIGIITSLNQQNDSFVYMYAAPIYIYSYLFNGFGNESIAMCVYYSLIGLCFGYFYFSNLIKRQKLLIISFIVLLHLSLSFVGLKTISKAMKEFLNSMPAEMIVDAISGKDNQ